jgi:hypothetical protein
MEHWIDDLARAAAGGLSRREALRRLGAGLAGGVLAALLPGPARAQPSEACREFCMENLTGAARGACLARGGGLCQACALDPERLCTPTDPDAPTAGVIRCCAANQDCGSPGCVPPPFASVATCPAGTTPCFSAGCCPPGTVCVDDGSTQARCVPGPPA